MSMELAKINVSVLDGECPPVTRALVQDFESAMRKLPQALQVDPKSLTVRHHFAQGLYLRELHIPAGMITTGKIHKYECFNILAKGRRSTLIDGKIVTVEAPHVHLSPPGIKRVSLTHVDSVWITAHATVLTDVNEIERELVCDTEEQYLEFLACGEHPQCLS
jgi:hypothetical protein